MQDNAVALHSLGALSDDLGNLIIIGIGEGNVPNESILEEGEGAVALGAVDDLIGNDEIHGLDLLLQRSDGGEADDGAYTDEAQSGNVCAGGDLMGRMLVVFAVAGQEGDGDTAVLENHDGCRGVSPWCQGVHAGDGDIAVDLVKTCATDHGDLDGSCRLYIDISNCDICICICICICLCI